VTRGGWRTVAILAVCLPVCVSAACGADRPDQAQSPPVAGSGPGPSAPGTVVRPGGPTTTAAPGGAANWTTYGHDPARSGVDPGGAAFSGLVHRWSSPPLDGAVYGQPLVVGPWVVVATEADTVFGLSALTGQVQWRTGLGSPVPRSDLPCGNIDPSGITGTPVIDAATSTVWVVAFERPAHHELVALDLTTGAVRRRRNVDPAGADPTVEQQRGALTLSGGRVYIPFGGLYGDCGNYHGYVVSVAADGAGGGGQLVQWQVPSGREAGIWAPGGAVVDAAGNLVVATGNSASTTAFDYGNAVLRLSADLTLTDWFAPADWAALNAGDADLGSTGPALVDGGSLIFQIGKSGQAYLLAEGQLGHLGSPAFATHLCDGVFGATAYAAPSLYVPCTDGVRAVRVGPGATLTSLWAGPVSNPGPPTVAGGVVWYLDTSAGDLVGLDPLTGRRRFAAHVGSVVHFAGVSAGGGRLFLVAGNRVQAFESS
jgi:outer membrane protein assembly factor BamB